MNNTTCIRPKNLECSVMSWIRNRGVDESVIPPAWRRCSVLWWPHLVFLLRGSLSGLCEFLLFLRTHCTVFVCLFVFVHGRPLPLTGLVVCSLGFLQLWSTQSHTDNSISQERFMFQFGPSLEGGAHLHIRIVITWMNLLYQLGVYSAGPSEHTPSWLFVTEHQSSRGAVWIHAGLMYTIQLLVSEDSSTSWQESD